MFSIDQHVNDVRHNVGHFVPNPHMRNGYADSAHQVMFGIMPDFGEVAVKPFIRMGQAQNERGAFEKAKDMGLETLEPIAIAMGGLGTYLITRYRDDLSHLGQEEWAVSIAESRLKDRLEPTLEHAGEMVADWHNAGLTHGDLQAKNLSYTPAGKVVFTDGERTKFHGDADYYTQAANRDLIKLGGSILRRGFLEDRSVRYRTEFLDNALLQPYLDTVTNPLTNQADDIRQQVITAYWCSALGAKTRLGA